MASFKIHLYKQRKLKKNLFNLTIRVIVGNDVQYLSIAKMTISQYKQVFEKNAMDDKSIEFRQTCNGYVTKCERIFGDMRTYNKKRFRELFFEKDKEIPKNLKVKDLFQYYIDNRPDLAFRTKIHLRLAGNVFDTFQNGLVVEDVTPEFLKKFERIKLDKGCSQATVDSYCRNLRTIINYCTDVAKIIPKSYQYPFGKGGYSISSFWPKKLVLSNEEIKRVACLTEFANKDEEYARDIWLFLYRCNGINFADLFRMRWDNIRGNNFIFFRKKTEKTRKNNKKQIVARITPKFQQLIDKIGVKDSPLILGLLEEGYQENTFENLSDKMRKIINGNLEEISKRLNLSVPLKTDTARDCYASTLRRAKVSKDDISDMLGHSNSIVTEHYLDSLISEETLSVNEVLF